MKKYLAFDYDNSEYKEFDTIEDAEAYLENCFLCEDEGYAPNTENYRIYEVVRKVKVNVIAYKKDFTDEEWDDEGYSSEFNEIWKHEFTK